MTKDDRLREFLTLFDAVDRGWVAVTKIKPSYIYPEYELTTGHKIKVFNDAGYWDYVEGFTTQSGEYIYFWDDEECDSDLLDDARHVEGTNEMVWDWDKANGDSE